MSTEVVVALVTSIVAILTALISAIVTYYGQIRATRLEQELQAQREARSAEAQTRQIISRYRDPLLSSAFDLQSRLYNIVTLGFLQRLYHLSERERTYTVNNTLYVVGEFLGWVEIVRREIQFLDLGDVAANQQFTDLLNNIVRAFSTGEYDHIFWLFRGEQRAIGEVMLTHGRGGDQNSLTSIGYAEFSRRLADPSFAYWFAGMKADIERLAKEPQVTSTRLRELQHALIDLILTLDPDTPRFPKRLLQKA